MDNNSGQYRKAHASMAMGQLMLAGYFIIAKVALNGGLNQLIFCVYSGVLAVFILVPVAYFSEKMDRPPITGRILLSFFFLGLTGIFGSQVLFLTGLGYTNPTFAAAFLPATPILTFLFALIMGIETLNLAKLEGKLKLGGIVICVGGALLMVFWRGQAVLFGDFKHHNRFPALTTTTPAAGGLLSSLELFGQDRWQIGALCIVGDCACYALYTTMQRPILSKYPATISVTAYSYFFGVVLMVMAGLLSTTNSTSWSLTRSELLAVLYSGIVSSALNYSLLTWSNKILGPALVSLYDPLQPVASAFLSMIFLRSPIYLESIIGGILIIAGLSMVTWGSYRERQEPVAEISGPLLDQNSNFSTQSSIFENTIVV